MSRDVSCRLFCPCPIDLVLLVWWDYQAGVDMQSGLAAAAEREEAEAGQIPIQGHTRQRGESGDDTVYPNRMRYPQVGKPFCMSDEFRLVAGCFDPTRRTTLDWECASLAWDFVRMPRAKTRWSDMKPQRPTGLWRRPLRSFADDGFRSTAISLVHVLPRRDLGR